MIITYLGHSCFKIQGKGESDVVTLVTDPFDEKIGLKVPACEADIVTVSHDHSDHNNTRAIKNSPFVVSMAGEYDIKGVLIQGVASFHDDEKGLKRGKNVIYSIEMEDVSIAHLGDLGHTLSDEQLESLVGTDILMIPVGGNYTIDAKKAVEVISQIEPRIVIPMHYKTDNSLAEVDELEKFIKELGIAPSNEIRLKVNKNDLPQEDMKLVVLSV